MKFPSTIQLRLKLLRLALVPGLSTHTIGKAVNEYGGIDYHGLFHLDLIRQTNNFGAVNWLGHPIWQNVLDLWTIQETIAEVRPDLLIECGTNRGGSALFYAHLFDLLGKGQVVSVDVTKMHNLEHPRVRFLVGSSTSEAIHQQIATMVQQSKGKVMVILDSDHSQAHVARELELYSPMVTPGSYCLVQDGSIDELGCFAAGRPGPLPAIEEFLQSNRHFELDAERCARFLITHHPKGWLRRVS